MPLDAEIYGYRLSLTRSLAVSVGMHAGLLAFVLLFPALLSHSGLEWGNNGSGRLGDITRAIDRLCAQLVGAVTAAGEPAAKR